MIVAGLPRKAFPRKQAFVDISVVLCLRKQQPRFAQGQPKGYFLTKRLDRTTEAIARMNIVWEGPVCWVQCANMWQDCSLSAVQRKTACVEQPWWPEFDMFGSMPWCCRATNFTQTPKKNKNDFWNWLSFGNAGPSSQANLYKSMPRSAFKSMTLWMNHGVQKV